MRKNFIIFTLLLIAFSLLLTQENENSDLNEIPNFLESAPKIYIDCYECDLDYIRENIQFVNYVRDRNVADVHVLFSKQYTGSGGKEYTLDFIGKNRFKNKKDALTFIYEKTDSEDQFRQKIVKSLKLGLIQFVAKTPLAKDINISFSKPVTKEKETIDKWNNWVYRISLGGFVSGEKSYNNLNSWGSLSANRVTEKWKTYISIHGSYNEKNYNWDEKVKVVTRNQSFYANLIKSLTNHWSAGFWANVYTSTYSNIDLSVQFYPGIEFNYFPYSESTRKQLRFQYKVIPYYNDYSEETIYFKTKEVLFKERITIVLELVQSWGSNTTTLSGSHYFHDFDKNALELYNSLSINIIKGLSFDITGEIELVHDQLALPLSEINIEDVYLHQKELESSYEYWCSFSFSYSFGSIYNNVVNPRFGN